MIGKILLWICILILLNFSVTRASSIDYERVARQSYSISNADIHKAIKRLENKLVRHEARHEYREGQLTEFSKKTLAALNLGHASTTKDVQAIAQQLAKMEERLFAMESLIQTTDERQRHLLKGLNEGINLLISRSQFNSAPPLPTLEPHPLAQNFGNELSSVVKTVKELDASVRNDLRRVDNEVKIVGESLSQHMEQLRERHDRLWTSVNTCKQEQMRSLSEVVANLTRTEQNLNKEIIGVSRAPGGTDCAALATTVEESFERLLRNQQITQKENKKIGSETMTVLKNQQKEIETLIEEEMKQHDQTKGGFNSVIEGLKHLSTKASSELNKLESTVREQLNENSDKLTNGINSVASILKLKTTNIMDAFEDSTSQRDNLEEKLTDQFTDLTQEIKGLKKVEQVMISTADAVLDTKRSIEFGIQQVIIELSEIVRHSGSTINSTLSDKINNISFAILKNQTSALTNMTAKMEREISQVWRQIGVMYQQVAQSVDILDDLQSSTSQQMNASLNQVNHMDGTVGKINSKVAGVEDDLNYLLGRLSLVVSEFSQMKSGVGQELEKLRSMAQEFSGGEIVEYKVKEKPPQT